MSQEKVIINTSIPQIKEEEQKQLEQVLQHLAQTQFVEVEKHKNGILRDPISFISQCDTKELIKNTLIQPKLKLKIKLHFNLRSFESKDDLQSQLRVALVNMDSAKVINLLKIINSDIGYAILQALTNDVVTVHKQILRLTLSSSKSDQDKIDLAKLKKKHKHIMKVLQSIADRTYLE